MKIPLKIKTFLWYLRRGVVLTKDNLAKRNWHRNQHCCFCHENEMIQHLFFNYRFTRLVWATIYVAWGLPQPRDVSSMFGNWTIGVPKEYKQLVRVGVAALRWSVWCCRNSVIFYNKQPSFLQVIYSITHWLCTWAILQQPTWQDVLVAASYFLEQLAKEFFVDVSL